MIVVQLIGGLGNQMFQYAFGRSLADNKRVDLKLDISWFDNIDNKDTQRRYELNSYPISAKTVDVRKLRLAGSENPKQSSRLFKLVQKPSLNVFHEPDQSFHKEVFDLKHNTYFVGYWQNEKYFTSIRPRLLKEFVPKKLSNYSKKMADSIGAQPSISIHVRRGDYATNLHTKKFHGLTPIEYYVKALERVEGSTKKLKIFVFSDDINWCRQSLPFARVATFVDGNSPERSYEDMYLMKLCEHNIIANSSFSWWGAWLNENPKKEVIAPKAWFQNKKVNKATDIVPKGWLSI